MSSTRHSVVRRRLATQLALTLIVVMATGCAARVPYPADWSPRDAAEERCEAPAGRFKNLPERSTDEVSLPLSEVFFGELLRGFDVTHVAIELLDSGELRVKPWVGDIELREERIVAPQGEACATDRWMVTAGWDVSGFMIAEGILLTGGLFIPAAHKFSFYLDRDQQGRLVVHGVLRISGTVLVFFPFNARDSELWFSYTPLPEEARSHGE